MYDFKSLKTHELLEFIKLKHNTEECKYIAAGVWAYKGFEKNKHKYQLVFNADDTKKDEFYVMTGTIGFDFEGNLSFELGRIIADNFTEDQAIRLLFLN